MKIYVASSWRNEERQQRMVAVLRKEGHEVYDFRNPEPGDHGFSWTQVLPRNPDLSVDRSALTDPQRFRNEVLSHPRARASFAKDMKALTEADAVVLVLPCGRSAHLELGIGIGIVVRKPTFVLLDDPMSEPELMYLACTRICITFEEVAEHVALWAWR
jgi:hypothetical protein